MATVIPVARISTVRLVVLLVPSRSAATALIAVTAQTASSAVEAAAGLILNPQAAPEVVVQLAADVEGAAQPFRLVPVPLTGPRSSPIAVTA